MGRNKSTEVVNESIRRMIDECMECTECMEDLDEVKFDPIQELVNPKEMKRLAALNNVMVRIIDSAQWN